MQDEIHKATQAWIEKANVANTKLEAETTAHTNTKEENNKLREEARKLEAVITRLRELWEKKNVWYDEQLVREREVTHQVEVLLNNEMGLLEELHLKESQIWAMMRSLYEEAATTNKCKTKNLKKALDEAQNCSQAIIDIVRIVLQTNREKFIA